MDNWTPTADSIPTAKPVASSVEVQPAETMTEAYTVQERPENSSRPQDYLMRATPEKPTMMPQDNVRPAGMMATSRNSCPSFFAVPMQPSSLERAQA